MPDSYTHRLKTLFWAAVFNFVFPVIFNITLIAMVFSEHDSVLGSYLVVTNNYVQIIGVLLATVFVAGRQGGPNGESAVHQLSHNHNEGCAYGMRVALQSVGSSQSHLGVIEITKSRGDSERSR